MKIKKKNKSDYFLLSEFCEIKLEKKLYESIKEIDIDQLKLPVIDFVNGVPGCGKTTYIVNNHNSVTDLVLTSTRESKMDIVRRVEKKNKIK